MSTRRLIYLPIFFLLLTFCREVIEVPEPPEEPSLPSGTSFLEASAQRSGDVSAGYDYLVNGDYVGAGIPLEIFKNVFGDDPENVLNRTGDNATLAPGFTAVTADNGVKMAAANCLQCHGQKLQGQFVVGLGNSLGDFTQDQSELVPALDFGIDFFYGQNSPEKEAYQPFRRALLATAKHLVMESAGVNPADKLAAVLAAHRDAASLTWLDSPQVNLPLDVVPTDVPAWWLLKKKHAMFYNGVGQGDFARIMMASSLLTMEDSAEAREVDQNFENVLSYILSLDAPAYPGSIDQTLAATGQQIFAANCQSCHGTYGDSVSYPNLLVSLDRVGTDPLLASSYFSETALVDWYNQSWFSQSPFAAALVPGDGYVAPPLDGIWATAPYLHNASVPDLESLLNSSTRPTFWKRSFDDQDYRLDVPGWNYTEESAQADVQTYNTTLVGYGNQGHTFGDNLTGEQRTALIEYLKTL
ncbi:MAG: c-type cytochrome [Bacteroidota bacterium]